MGMPSMPELLIILAIIVLLFGAKKIPDLAKGMGKGIKSFKKEMSNDEEEKEEVATSEKVEDKAATNESTIKESKEA